MKFGEYLERRIEELGLTQGDLPGFSQSYIANIIAGRNNPTKRSTIAKLADALSLEPGDQDWLMVYSLLDTDPRERFRPKEEALAVYEQHNHYTPHHGRDIEITINSTENDVQRRLGPPDKRFVVPPKSKWVYEKEGLHIIFAEGRVIDVMFK